MLSQGSFFFLRVITLAQWEHGWWQILFGAFQGFFYKNEIVIFNFTRALVYKQ